MRLRSEDVYYSSEGSVEDDVPTATDVALNSFEAVKESLQTALIVHIAMPALNFAEHINFKMRPESRLKVIDGIEDFINHLANEFTPDLMYVEKDSTEFRLDHIRKRAVVEFNEWQAKLQSVEKVVREWKSKVDRATELMNKMRDSYYKELFHLREQVYRQKNADEKGKGAEFQPIYAIHFDPSEYTIENEVARLVADKISFIRQEFETKQTEMDMNYKTRLRSLTETLKSSKMLLSRKEVFCKKLMDELGCKDEDALENTLKQRDLAKEQTKWFGPKSLLEFINRKFGSVIEARETIERAWDSREGLSLTEFERILEAMGYILDEPQKAFLDLAGGSPVLTLSRLFECIAPEQCGKSKLAEKTVEAMTSDHPDLASSTIRDSFDPFKLEADDLRLGADLEDFGKSSSDGGNECSDNQSALSDGSNKSHGRRSIISKMGRRSTIGGCTKARRASAPSRAASIFSRKKTNSEGIGKKANMSTMTVVSYDCCLQKAFSTIPAVAWTRELKQTADVGTDCRLYKDAFPKVKMVSRACQSQVNGDMLRKAMDYFDHEAEELWNQIAGTPVLAESDSESETPEAQGATGSTINTKDQCNQADKGGDMEFKVDRRVKTFDMGDIFDFGGIPKEPRLPSNSRDMALFQKSLERRNINLMGARCIFKSTQVQAGSTSWCDSSIQCDMKDMTALQKWFPMDEDPFEFQLQQILDAGHELEARLPEFRSWAEKLANIYSAYAQPETRDHRDRDVIEKLNRFRFVGCSVAKPEVPRKSFIAQWMEKESTTNEKLVSGKTVASLLKGHGILGEVETKHHSNEARFISNSTNAMMPQTPRNGSKEKPPNANKRPVRMFRSRTTPNDLGCDSDSSDGDVAALISGRRSMKTATCIQKPVIDSAQLIVGKARRRSLEQETPGTTNDSFLEASTHTESSSYNLPFSEVQCPGWSGLIGESTFEKRNVQIEVSNSAASTEIDVGCPSTARSEQEDLGMRLTFENDQSMGRPSMRDTLASQAEVHEIIVVSPNLLTEFPGSDVPRHPRTQSAFPNEVVASTGSRLKKLPRLPNTQRIETPSRQSQSPRVSYEPPQQAVCPLALPEDVGCSLRVTAEMGSQKQHDRRSRLPIRRPGTSVADSAPRRQSVNGRYTDRPRTTGGHTLEGARVSFGVQGERKTVDILSEPHAKEQDQDMLRDLEAEVPHRRTAPRRAPLGIVRKVVA